ncbi:MAG: S9 family peptidase [Zavarzinella sp.]|nr:S9 family peptidase [Zavarzinella sp.]
MTRNLFVLLLLAVPATAQPQAVRDHAITLDDYATLALITELAISPDGKQVAYCEARWDKADDQRKADLWVVATDGKGKPTRLTGDRANDRHPKWSADGKAVYVLGNRKRDAETKPPYDGKTQVWRVPLNGGEPQAVTKVDGGVTGFGYAPKADILFYSTDSSATDNDDFTSLRSRYKLDYGHGTRKTSEIHRLDLQSWRAEKVIGEGRYVHEFAVTPDGKRVAMITTPDDTVVKFEGQSRVDVWDADTKKVTVTDESWRKTAASPWPWLESLAWAPDGQRLAFCTIFDAHPAEIIIDTLQGGTWTAERMKRPEEVHVRGYGSPLQWRTDSALVWLGERNGSVGVRDYDASEHKGYPHTVDGVAVAFDFAGSHWAMVDGSLSTLHLFDETHSRPVHANPQTHSWKRPTTEHIWWKAPDGTEVGGILELPPDYKKGDKLPLVVGIHGGPTTATYADLNYDAHNGRLYFAAHGYAALFPNYRGSTGYGDKFVTDLVGHENDIEVKDILAGIQHLIQEGIADPDRIGVMGWSNGGYLTNCLIALKDPPVKFKAASSGAGILDTVAEWGFNDEPAYPMVFKKGLPWETPDVYRKTSPIYGLGNVTTPTLIHVGGGDERCPPGHSRSLYRALKEYKKVPTELIVYSNEPHGLTKLSNRTAKMAWDLAWFDKYLK